MQNVCSGIILADQNSSSSGTVWKSSSSSSSVSRSEHCGKLLSGLAVVSMLSSLKDRWHLTDLAGECVGVQVAVLCGVLCTGLKDALSKLEM